MLSVAIGTTSTEFTYDGLDRRVRIVEKDGSTTTSDKRFVWCDLELCEERDATAGTVAKRFLGQGVQENGTSFFYARDHLFSVRELTDTTGALRARYDYDPYGRRSRTAGDKDVDLGFGGMFTHAPSGLLLTVFRAYDPSLGGWLSEDPLGVAAGLNRYLYVSNRTTVFNDPFGLQQQKPQSPQPPQESTIGWLWRVYVKELFTSYGPDTASDTATAVGETMGRTAGSKGLGALGDVVTSSTTFLDLLKIQSKHDQEINQAIKCSTDPSCGIITSNPSPLNPLTPTSPSNSCKQ